MKQSVLYSFVKRISDSSAKLLSQWLPEWKPVEVSEAVGAVESFEPTLPVNFAHLRPELAPFFTEHVSLPASKLFVLRNVNVSWHAVVFKNFKIFQPALAHPFINDWYTDSYLFKQWLAPTYSRPEQKEPIMLVHDQWTRGNYYHWVVDALSRLLIARRRHPNALLLMPAPVPAYVQETAEMLGFTRLLPLEENQILKVEQLIIPEHVTPPGLQNPALLRELRQAIVGHFYPSGQLPKPTRRVYVSRSRQNSRHLANEAAAVALLARYGFETVYFEDYTFAQQVALMQETAVLLGVHGANLTNLLFLQPGSTVIELMNEEKFIKLENKDFENLIYYRMSSGLQLPYYVVFCHNVADQPASNYSDMEVDLPDLEGVLARL